jgi:hypothetical protein
MGLPANAMKNETEIREEIEALRSLTTLQLKEKYREVFGEESRSNHKQFLFRRIAWRIQANAWGGLSERARKRALEIADDADLRIRAPKNFLRQPPDDGRTVEARLRPSLDPRLPLPGTPLIRRYQGKDIIVHVRGRRVRMQRQDPHVPQQGGHRSDGHAVERFCVLWPGTSARGEAWQARVTATGPARPQSSGAPSIPGSRLRKV